MKKRRAEGREDGEEYNLAMKKRCAEGREDGEELMKMYRTLLIRRCLRIGKKAVTRAAAEWSDLELDILGEIRKKLYYADHIRFGGVCKSWLAAQHEKRADDVLPWLMVFDRHLHKLSYKLYQPSAPVDHPVISDTIYLDKYFDDTSNFSCRTSVTYVHGLLHIGIYNWPSKSSSLFLFSPATKSSFTLPRFNHPAHPFHIPLVFGFSASPSDPDCVFLALHLTDEYTRAIGIFRHGDTQWTTIESVGGWFGPPLAGNAVFIRGVFYFFLSSAAIGSYDLATGALKVDTFATVLHCLYPVFNFFGLDGDLMLAYQDFRTLKFCISKYDWSHKLWVPLQSLDGRSLFLTSHSVYVDPINHYEILSANKVFIRKETTFCVYSLEDDGQLLECTTISAARLRNWDGLDGLDHHTPYSLWVDPPDALMKLGDTLLLKKMMSRGTCYSAGRKLISLIKTGNDLGH